MTIKDLEDIEFDKYSDASSITVYSMTGAQLAIMIFMKSAYIQLGKTKSGATTNSRIAKSTALYLSKQYGDDTEINKDLSVPELFKIKDEIVEHYKNKEFSAKLKLGKDKKDDYELFKMAKGNIKKYNTIMMMRSLSD